MPTKTLTILGVLAIVGGGLAFAPAGFVRHALAQTGATAEKCTGENCAPEEAAIAIPNLLDARKSGNESSAIGTLQTNDDPDATTDKKSK